MFFQEIYWCWLWSVAELLGGAMAAGVFRLLRREEFAQAILPTVFFLGGSDGGIGHDSLMPK